jgi:hypothetical protein
MRPQLFPKRARAAEAGGWSRLHRPRPDGQRDRGARALGRSRSLGLQSAPPGKAVGLGQVADQGCRLGRGRTECSLNVQTTFLPLPNHFFHSAAHPALLGGKPSWRCQVKQETNRSSKTSRPVTLKHLAAALAEEHQLTKRAGEAVISSALSQSILRRANESVLRASVSCKVRKRAA